jgi:magnesium and cobalt exporter, CNNM family
MKWQMSFLTQPLFTSIIKLGYYGRPGSARAWWIDPFIHYYYEVAGLLLLLVCSAFFSGSETALFSLTRDDLRKLDASDQRASSLIRALLRSPQSLLSAILFGNMIVNVTFYTLSFVISRRVAETSPALAAGFGLGSLFAVILLGEVTPKGIAVGRPLAFSHLVAPVLYPYTRLVRPMSRILRGLARNVTGWLAVNLPHVPHVTREELKMLAGMAEQHGALDADTRGMVQQVVDLAQIRVNEIMTPRVDMAMFDIADDRAALTNLIRETHEERFSVYEQDADHIIGILVARDAFLHPHKSMRDLLRPVRFVPETQTLESLLRQFRESGEHVAVAVDEYGGTAGLVDAELIIEEVVGDIRDEYEAPEEPVFQVDEDTYLLAGDLNTREWKSVLGIADEMAGVETLGGLVTALLGHIPKLGDSVQWQGLWLTVEKMSRRRVELVRVERVEDQEGGE